MRGLDDTDRSILDLLLEDARRPYSDIAERVDLSAPAVSDRVERLRDIGLVRRFTADVDRSMLREGVPVLVELETGPQLNDTAGTLTEVDATEHVFETASGRVVCTMTAPDGAVRELLSEHIDLGAVDSLSVEILTERAWRPGVGDSELAPACAECGNTVTTEGETATLDGDTYQFCCTNCESAFVERYEQFRAES